MDNGLLLGVDIGTSGSKGVLVTPQGRVLARATRPHRVSTPAPGRVEHDAERDWWDGFVEIARQLVDAAEGRPLAGLGVSGIGPCVVPADAGGAPLRPAILYGVDTRAGREIEEITGELGAEAILARGGSPLTSQALGPKLRWLACNEPKVYARTRMWLMASSFLVHRLTGAYVLDHHSASQCDPLYDMAAGDWARDWAEAVAPGLPLPELRWPTEVAGTVTPEAARATGLPAGLPVTAGTIDAWAEATSVGVYRPGDAMVMYGTTMFLVQVLKEAHPVPGLWTTRGAFPGTTTLAAGMATSGAVTDWLRELVRGDFADLVAEAAGVPAGSRGLLMLPYFAGERTPLFDPDARGTVMGLTTRHGRAELYRAALEATAFGVRHNFEEMHTAGGRPARLVAVGGGTQGALWPQIVSDVTGTAQEVPAETIGACLGDAFLAARATGTDADPETWNPVTEVVHPRADTHARYNEFYTHYRRLYADTAETAHFLAEQQQKSEGRGDGDR